VPIGSTTADAIDRLQRGDGCNSLHVNTRAGSRRREV